MILSRSEKIPDTIQKTYIDNRYIALRYIDGRYIIKSYPHNVDNS